MNKLEIYIKFLAKIMEEEDLSIYPLVDTETFTEYLISRTDEGIYISPYKLSEKKLESLIKDFLISRLMDMEGHIMSFLEESSLYAISLDSDHKFLVEIYERKFYEEDLEFSIDKH